MTTSKPPALDPTGVTATNATAYPSPYREAVAGRWKKKLGDAVGLKNFGVNLVTLEPGARSSMRHWHTRQDEFVYLIEGELVLHTDAGRQTLQPGMCAGFPAGKPDGHCLINESRAPALYLEIGDRTAGDGASYPDVDLAMHSESGAMKFTRKDGRSFE